MTSIEAVPLKPFYYECNCHLPRAYTRWRRFRGQPLHVNRKSGRRQMIHEQMRNFLFNYLFNFNTLVSYKSRNVEEKRQFCFMKLATFSSLIVFVFFSISPSPILSPPFHRRVLSSTVFPPPHSFAFSHCRLRLTEDNLCRLKESGASFLRLSGNHPHPL